MDKITEERIGKYKAIVGKLIGRKPLDNKDTGFLVKEKVVGIAVNGGWGHKAYYGTWRITKMSEWDREYCDSEVPAFISIKHGGSGEFQFGLVSASLHGGFKEINGERIFDFTWEGSEEYDSVSGDGWMRMKESGTAEGEFRFHGGDKSMFWAKRKKEKIHSEDDE